jgi:ribosomal protein S18 acetylase RimI-like enzyme
VRFSGVASEARNEREKLESDNRKDRRRAEALKRRKAPIIYRIAHEHEHDAILTVAKTSRYLHDFGYRIIWSSPQAYERGLIRVAECDGEIVAFVSFWVKKNRTVVIRHLGVHPDYRRRGIGRALVELIDAAVPKSGFFPRPIVLNCATRNVAGIAFWERMGFKAVKPALKGKGVLFQRERIKFSKPKGGAGEETENT